MFLDALDVGELDLCLVGLEYESSLVGERPILDGLWLEPIKVVLLV